MCQYAMLKMDSQEDMDMDMWYTHPVYTRYWQHYQQAMSWFQRHRRAYNKAIQSAYDPAFYPVFPTLPRRYADWHDKETAHRCPTQTRRRMEDEADSSASESSEESELEYDVSKMDITAELRQYFAQTERHKEELKRQQQMEAERQEAYVPADQDLHRSWRRSAQAPAERPGERRSAEMKKLYGKDAAKIQGMETAMQLNFDRNCDRKQPKYWPVIPLKL
ncbi:gem-associated protein 8 isoform X3 [Silurus meridionalis]|uniref:gem-associated protein 8 isoform X3 n=1 Tax=Silurus meridionalis TaxID=175797 RepID=UPI001EEB2930|nr:gem-associated protein 8 isoform X3 [Silurus meridionalis]